MHYYIIPAALAAAIALAGVTAAQAATPAAALALHPECYTVGRTLVVRGAVTAGRDDAPVADAVVTLRAGDQTLVGRTGADGIYTATAPAPTHATTIREISTAIQQTGSHVPVDAQEGAGGCRVAGVNVGRLHEVR